MNLKITLGLLMLTCVQFVWGQNGETCTDAVEFPYFEGMDTCGIYNNVGATTDVGGVIFDPFGPLSCPTQENEVWFKFTPSGTLFDLVITVEGQEDLDNGIPAMLQPRVSVLVGSCPADYFEASVCSEAGLNESVTSLTLDGSTLIPGFSYYVIVSDWSATAGSNEGAFSICFEELTEITVPPTGGSYTSCTGIIHDTGGPDGDYSSNEDYTINICPTESFNCLRLEIDHDMDTDYQSIPTDFMEIYGEVPNVAGEQLLSIVQGVSEGLVVLSTGCVRIEFESGNSIEEAGYTINWSCSMNDDCYSSSSISSLNVNSVSTDTTCLNECFDLEATPTEIIETSGGYVVEPVPYEPFPFIGENEVVFPGNEDDGYSSVIDLPFDFSFYGGSFSQVVVGSNGVLSFNTALAGQNSGYTFTNDLPSNANVGGTNPPLTNAIMFPWHDINPGDTNNQGGAFWSVYGEAPLRVFVVSISNVTEFQCNIAITQQVALYETSNIIETYISNKPSCSWNNGDGIHAIQNSLGNQATVVPGRNLSDSPWVSSNDGMRFSPDAAVNGTVPFTIGWTNEHGESIGSGNVVETCADTTSVYYAEVTYNYTDGTPPVSIVDSLRVVVTTQEAIVYDFQEELIICSGESVAIGGDTIPNVTYTWTPAMSLDLTDPANPIASPAATTTYGVDMTNGFCDASTSITVTVVDDPTPNITGSLEICSNGGTTLDAGAGYASYQWSTSPDDTTQTLDIDALGDYTVTVTLASGCTGEATVSVLVSSGVTAEVTSVAPNSCDTPNGSISIEVLTGTPPYIYNWTGDAAGQEANPVGLTAGDYTVTISDAGGCEMILTATVDQQDALEASVDEDTICIAEAVQLNATGGNGTYVWSASDGSVSDPHIANPTANPTSTTTYYVVSETNTGNLVSNGDFEAGDSDFTSNYVPGMGGTYGDLSNEATYGIYTSPDLGHNNFSPCADHTSGTGNMLVVNGAGAANQNVWCQTVTVIPGTDYNFSAWATSVVTGSPAQLQFEINGSALGDIFSLPNVDCDWQQYNAFWNAGAATSATICILNQNTSAGGNDFALDDITLTTYCTQQDSVIVYVSEPEVAVLGANDDFCGSSQGSIAVEPSGGYGPYTYEWSANANGQTTSTITGLAGGQAFFVTATDAYGCTNQISAYVQDLGFIPVEIVGMSVICPGSGTTLEAGPVEYDTYLWSDDAGTATSTLEVTQAGDYTVTVTSGTCSGTATISVTLGESATPVISGPDVVCVDDMITLGLSESYATYQWSSDMSTEATLDVTGGGDYTVTVTTPSGCSGTASYTVNQSDLTVNITGTVGLCLGDVTTLSAATQGAVTWYDNEGMELGTGSYLTYTPAGEGTYEVIAEAIDNDCSVRDTAIVTVDIIPTLSVEASETEVCMGTSVDLTATSDAGVTWEPVNEFTDPTLLTQTVTPTGSTVYSATAGTDGCSVTETIAINVTPGPVFSVIPDVTICPGESLFIGDLDDPGTTYSWESSNADEELDDADVGRPVVTPTETTTYTLTASNGECTETDFVQVTVDDSPTLTATASPEEILVLGDSSTLALAGAPVGASFVWEVSGGEAIGNDATVTVSPTETTTYTVTMTTPNGCVYVLDVTVTVTIILTDVEVPNMFTPNNDELNDGFRPVFNPAGATLLEFKVFDRWGEMVHDSVDEWRGKFKGEDLPSDVYVYFCRVRFNDGTEEFYKGDVTLMR